MVTETKDLVVLMAKLGTAVAESLEDDGKVSLSDLANFIDPVTAIPAAISGITDIDDEFVNMTEADKMELKQAFQAELDLADDELEGKFEAAFSAALELAKAVEAFA